MNLERLGEMTREERIKLYNRPDATHRKISPIEYGEQPPGAWGEAYRTEPQAIGRIRQSMKG